MRQLVFRECRDQPRNHDPALSANQAGGVAEVNSNSLTYFYHIQCQAASRLIILCRPIQPRRPQMERITHLGIS
jgi:hypothetical protein